LAEPFAFFGAGYSTRRLLGADRLRPISQKGEQRTVAPATLPVFPSGMGPEEQSRYAVFSSKHMPKDIYDDAKPK
jgi:hypothetical protein